VLAADKLFKLLLHCRQRFRTILRIRRIPSFSMP
jgi:hypothetical protein